MAAPKSRLNIEGSKEYIKRRKKKEAREQSKGRGLRPSNLDYEFETWKMEDKVDSSALVRRLMNKKR